MKATVRGVVVEGTVEEIKELMGMKEEKRAPVYQPKEVTPKIKKVRKTKRVGKQRKSGYVNRCPHCHRNFRPTYAQLALKEKGKRIFCSPSCATSNAWAKRTPEERKFRTDYMRACRQEKIQQAASN